MNSVLTLYDAMSLTLATTVKQCVPKKILSYTLTYPKLLERA